MKINHVLRQFASALALALLFAASSASGFYDPGTQRWINRDPIGEGELLNLSCFANGDPAELVDVDGLQVRLSPSSPQRARTPPLASAPGGKPPPPPATPPPQVWPPPGGQPFPSGPASASCPGYLGGREGGNFPDYRGSNPPRPCNQPGQRTKAKPNGRTQTKDCPCSGTQTATCYTYDQCDFWSWGTGGSPKFSWQTHEECPCPEYSTY